LIDDLDNAAAPNNGLQAGVGTNPAVPETAEPLEEITFNLYKITIPNLTAPLYGADIFPYDGEYSVDLEEMIMTDGEGQEFDIVAADTPSVETDDEGIAVAEDLPLGFYLVVEQPDERVSSPAAPFVVAVPMTDPEGDGWITDVHVYPKNDDIGIDKTPSQTSNFIGDTVTWTIEADVPADIEDYVQFDITDLLDDALTFVPDSVEVFAMTSKTDANPVEIPETADGELTNWEDTLEEDEATGQMLLTVALDQDGAMTILGDTDENDYKVVRVTFDTIVNEGALDKIDYTIPNKPILKFTNAQGEEKDREGDEPEVHTAAIVIDKTDANTDELLVGAVFQIASSEANALAGDFLKLDDDGNVIDENEEGYDDANEWTETTAVDPNDATRAIAVFEGLKDYTGEDDDKVYRSYWLVEVDAPEGYNLLDDAVQVTFTSADNKAAHYTHIQGIANTTEFTLPKTGGMETLFLTIGGIVVVGVAVLFIILGSKGKKKEKQAK
jgi:fimbrial isopeptide formation D2 family protein/LPXTG-motif cell wall-anchored protein